MSDESQLVPLEQVAVAEAGAEGAVVQQQASSSGSAAENPLDVVAYMTENVEKDMVCKEEELDRDVQARELEFWRNKLYGKGFEEKAKDMEPPCRFREKTVGFGAAFCK